MPDVDVAGLRRLLEAATPGEWGAAPYDSGEDEHFRLEFADGRDSTDMTAADVNLIATMHAALPALLSRIERGEKIEAAAREYLHSSDLMTCESVGHDPSEYHFAADPCPVAKRSIAACEALRDALLAEPRP